MNSFQYQPYGNANSCEDYYEKKRQMEEYEHDMRILQMESAKAAIRIDGKVQAMQVSTNLKQEAEERKRATYEQININETGEISVITKNLQIEASPRTLTNLRCPSIVKLTRVSNTAESVYELSCYVGENLKKLYFSPKKLGSGAYILGKFTASGIGIMAPAERAKDYARQLVCLLISSNFVEEFLIPDQYGWIETEDDKFLFIEEGSMLWKHILDQL